MKLEIIHQEQTFEAIQSYVESFFNCPLRFIKEDLSIFQSYQIRPKEHIHIKSIWKYRIIFKNSTYSFGTTI
jgi:hypothetical protein